MLSSKATPNQAFSLAGGRLVGLQCHLEWTPQALAKLVEECGEELARGRALRCVARGDARRGARADPGVPRRALRRCWTRSRRSQGEGDGGHRRGVGRHQAVRGRDRGRWRESRYRRGRDLRAARTQRRGQDHHDIDDLVPSRSRRGRHPRGGALGDRRLDRSTPSAGDRPAGDRALPHAHRRREPQVLGPHVRAVRQGARRGGRLRAFDGRPRGQGEGARRDLLGRHEAAHQHRRRHPASAHGPADGRANSGHRPAEPQPHPRHGARPQPRGHDGRLHEPLHGRGRGAVRPHRDRRPRPLHRARHAR